MKTLMQINHAIYRAMTAANERNARAFVKEYMGLEDWQVDMLADLLSWREMPHTDGESPRILGYPPKSLVVKLPNIDQEKVADTMRAEKDRERTLNNRYNCLMIDDPVSTQEKSEMNKNESVVTIAISGACYDMYGKVSHRGNKGSFNLGVGQVIHYSLGDILTIKDVYDFEKIKLKEKLRSAGEVIESLKSSRKDLADELACYTDAKRRGTVRAWIASPNPMSTRPETLVFENITHATYDKDHLYLYRGESLEAVVKNPVMWEWVE